MKLPFEIPPFDPGKFAPKTRYDWWAWSPCYPWWSRSCWGGSTEEEARAKRNRCEGDLYALALIKEERGVFTVIEQHPPENADAWNRIAAKEYLEARR